MPDPNAQFDENDLRFVVLWHELPHRSTSDGRSSHLDVMLQFGDQLETWSVEQPLEDGSIVAAIQLADHRLAYLDYEGSISGNSVVFLAMP